MKKLVIILVIALCALSIQQVAAQYRSESNRVRTKVGNPTVEIPTPGQKTPAPPCPSDCRQAVIDTFGVTVSTAFPTEYFQFAWQKLWGVSHTNFDELVRGTSVERDDSGSQRIGNSIYIRGTYDQSFFDIIFVHEMGHIINDMDDTVSFKTEHDNLWRDIGALTGYGASACLYESPQLIHKLEENYADLIAYYLNPEERDRTTGSCSTGELVFANGANREYFELGKKILGEY